MNNFRTCIKVEKSTWKLNYRRQFLFIGSCFTENIGFEMQKLKYQVDINPFGIVYNPLSVRNSLQFLMQNQRFQAADLHFLNENWYSFFHHSRFSHFDKTACLSGINTRIETSHKFLQQADYLIVTFGTAWVYALKKTGQVVSNCHKNPPNLFKRYLLDVDSIVQAYRSLIADLRFFAPQLKIIFTISPVRHWKDGASGNMLSKSVLKLAIQQLCDTYNFVDYFPAYEIMMDDLRDYRFYTDDMLHPNRLAISYIWKHFTETYFTEESFKIMPQIEKLNKAEAHKAFNPKSEVHQKFLRKHKQKQQQLQKRYPFLNL